MVRDGDALFLLISVYLYVVLKPYLLSGAWRRDKLCRTSDVQVDASIIKCKPIKLGIWGGAHFELAVEFSDESTYRTELGRNVQVRHNKWRYYYTDKDLREALRKAFEEHEMVAHGVKDWIELPDLGMGINAKIDKTIAEFFS